MTLALSPQPARVTAQPAASSTRPMGDAPAAMSREDVLELVRDAVEEVRLARSPVAACVIRLPRDPSGEAVEVRPGSLERDACLGWARGGEHVLRTGEVELLEQRELGCRDDDGDRGAGIAGHRRIPVATIRAVSDTVPAHA